MRDCKAVIEFGTSKITCAIAEQKQRMGLEVLGCAKIPYAGIKDGNWVDSERVYYAIDEALATAEHQAGVRLRKVNVGIPGSFLRIVNRTCQMTTSGRITENDISAAVTKASRFDMDRDYVMLEAAPAWFLLDDGNVYIDPPGLTSKKAQASITFTFANRLFMNDVSRLMDHLGIQIDSFVSEPLAEALYLVPQDRRDDLAVLVDIGYSTTGVSVIYGDAILFYETIPLGGANITSDIAYIKKVDLETAEQLKQRYSFGLAVRGSDPGGEPPSMYAKDASGKLQKYSYEEVSGIIDARVEQIIQYVTEIVAVPERSLRKKLDVFLTGGGISFIRGANSFYHSVAGKTPVPISVNSIKLSDPDLHAAYAMLQHAYGDQGIKPKPRRKGLFGKQENIY